MIRHVEEVLKERNIGFQKNASTAALSGFQIGGPAELLILPRCRGELVDAVDILQSCGRAYFVIGAASNLLFDDAKLQTALIRTTAIDAIKSEKSGLSVDCGVRLNLLAARAAALGLAGLEFAAGIPGTLGGAIFMNAGANGSEIAQLVDTVDVYDPKTRQFFLVSGKEAGFSYRHSRFQNENLLILGARLHLSRDEPEAIKERMQALLQRRRETQPTMPSAGSAFRRPAPDVPLSRILDELGLKGLSVGGAAVSRKHAGFIVNNGGATAADVRALMTRIGDIVEKEKGIRPMPEIRFVKDER